MPKVETYEPGTFCWTDLATTDIAGAKAFYGELFGWSMEDVPTGDSGAYTMCTVRGEQVCAMAPQNQMMKGAPPVWLSYVWVDSADDAAAKAKELGGKAVMPAFDVMEAGRMAVLEDPTGAVFAVWQAKNHGGASLVNEPGAPVWNELITDDTGKAGAFYQGMFGWQPKQTGDYIEMNRGEGKPPAGGMMAKRPEMGPTPNNWGVYFAVADTDETAKRAQSLGGKVFVPPTDIPNVGRFAVLQDPQGGVFSVLKLTRQ